MPFHDVIQRTDAHAALRLGRVTASRIADIIAKGKGGEPSAGRRNYLAELAIERLTGKIGTHYSSRPMDHGTDAEPESRSFYSFETDNVVLNGGFYVHDSIEMFGASPDGRVGEEGVGQGLTEFKNPLTSTHIENLLGKKISGRYQTQMQSQMSASGRQWVDHVSFDVDMPVPMRYVRTRIYRDPAVIVELERAVRAFLQELDETVTELKRRFG